MAKLRAWADIDVGAVERLELPVGLS